MTFPVRLGIMIGTASTRSGVAWMAQSVRLIDIARRLGLTKVSVSKALRDHPDISEATRALVKQTAAEMGYMPNLLARSLSSRRSFTLGVVVPKIAHTFFASVIDAVQSRATEAGYGIVLAVSNERAALERQHIDRLLSMRVDGLLVSASQQAPVREVYERVRAMRVPLVFFDREIEGLGFGSVTVDDRAGAFDAIEHAIGQGYTRIAHVAGTQETAIGRARRAGFEAAMAAHGLPVRDGWLLPGGFDEWHGYHACLRLLEDEERPEVIFTVTYPVGLGVRGALRERAPELLDRIEIIDFGEGELNAFAAYPHTCVSQPTRAMGTTAVDMVLRLIAGDDPGAAERVVLPTRIVTPHAIQASLQRQAAHRETPDGDGGS